MKVLSRLRYVLLTMVLMVLLWTMLVWLNETHQDIGAQARATNVARLVDANTALFVHVPDLTTAHDSFGSADFTKLGIHDGMSAIAKQILRDIPDLIHLSKHWDQCQSLNITEATLTVTPETDRLTVLTLFRTEGDPAALWESCVGRWKAKSDQAEDHIEERDGVRYRYLTDTDRKLIQSSWGGWHFVSNDEAMLKRAMARLRAERPANALSEHEVFQQSLVPLQSDYLVLSYISQSEAEISSQASKGRQRFDKIHQNLRRFHARSTARTATVKRGHMIEEAFVVTDSQNAEEETGPSTSSITEATLPLTSPQTLAYATADLGSQRIRQFLLGQFVKRWEGAEVPAMQQVAAVWKTHFTSTWSLQLEPIEPRATEESMPENDPLATILAFVLNDEAKVKANLETLSQTEGSGIKKSSLQTYVLEHGLLPSVLTNLLEEVHLHVEHGLLIVSDRVQGIHQVARRWNLKQDLKQRSDFFKLLSSLPKPGAGLSFIDSESLLIRGSEALQHPLVIATLWMALHGNTPLEINLNQLARSLTANVPIAPTVATWQRTSQGYLESSIGTLSPLQWAIGGGAIIAAIDKAFLDRTPITDTDNFASPAIEEELLQMMEP
ncbi:MAG: hypothetical protein ACI8T1_004561 [Verrucomicrobiales bacterium]